MTPTLAFDGVPKYQNLSKQVVKGLAAWEKQGIVFAILYATDLLRLQEEAHHFIFLPFRIR